MIPTHAKQVFQGIIFSVWQWEQQMFDGTTKTFEKLKRPDTVNVLPVVGDKLLILKLKQPHHQAVLALPGGRCEEGEDFLATAQRELLEETGYEAEKYALWRSFQPEEKIEWTIHTYIGHNATQAQSMAADNGERIEPLLLTFEEFLLLTDDPNFRHPDIAHVLLRARFDKSKRDELHTLIFGRK